MQTGKSTIRDVFDGTRIFNIPVYQRSYSWEKEDNLFDFLNDIVNQHPERQYFLGSFLFHLNGNKGDFSIVDVVDGQQRLTTFVIFIDALIQRLIKLESKLVSARTRRTFIQDDDVFKLETANEDNTFLHGLILTNSETQEDTQPKTKSQRLLLEAKKFFTDKLAKFDLSDLERIYKTATNADVLLYVVDKISSATQTFELLNDRGRKLTDLESIKSFLMYNAGLVSNNPDQVISNIQTDFSEIYRLLEQHELNDSDILRYHTIAFERCPSDLQDKPKEFIKSKITALVNNPEAKHRALSEIKDYSSRLKTSFYLYVDLQQEKYKRAELAQFFMIGRIAPFYPVLLCSYKDYKETFDDLLHWLNQFTFKASLIGLRSNGESSLYRDLRKNLNPLETVKTITKDNWWNINKRALDAINYDNYYEWLSKNTVRYILFSYENHLRHKKGYPLLSINEYFTDKAREKLSIEHISAQRAKGIEHTEEEYKERYRHSIGNLVIDYAASNSRKGNKNTGDKLYDFNQAPLMSQNRIDESNCDWTHLPDIKQFIIDREVLLRTFIKERFDLD